MNLNYIEEENRVVIETDDKAFVGEVTFQRRGDDVLVVDHTFVDSNFRGQGIAEKLAIKAIEVAIDEKRKIVPACSYIKKYLDDNKDLQYLEYHG